MQQKNCIPIDALRFIFMMMICLWHCNGIAPFLTHGYIAVEFFFILSGFLIYKSFISHKETGALDFTIKKIKRFYTPYILSIILMMLLDRKQYLFLSNFSAEGVVKTYFSHIPEYLMLQNIGIYDGYEINGPLWFISVLIIGGGHFICRIAL